MDAAVTVFIDDQRWDVARMALPGMRPLPGSVSPTEHRWHLPDARSWLHRQSEQSPAASVTARLAQYELVAPPASPRFLPPAALPVDPFRRWHRTCLWRFDQFGNGAYFPLTNHA